MGDSMMTRVGFAAVAVAALGGLCAGVVYADSGQQSLDRLRPQEQMQLLSDAADQTRVQAGAADDGSSAAAAQGVQGAARQDAAGGPAEPDPKLEQTRLRLEQELKEQRQMTGDFDAEPAGRRPDMRFGVGYEFRMKGRQELGFDSPGSITGGGRSGIPGAGNGAGFGGGRR
jgi:hypothetical protein